MGTIEIFEHTADVGIRIRAVDLNDLFCTAATALLDYIVVNRTDVRVQGSETIRLSADSIPDLLATWLSELIFLSETKHFLYASFDVEIAEDHSLSATVGGEPIDRDRHILDHEVKAVTRHALSVDHANEGWVAEFILDI